MHGNVKPLFPVPRHFQWENFKDLSYTYSLTPTLSLGEGRVREYV